MSSYRRIWFWYYIRKKILTWTKLKIIKKSSRWNPASRAKIHECAAICLKLEVAPTLKNRDVFQYLAIWSWRIENFRIAHLNLMTSLLYFTSPLCTNLRFIFFSFLLERSRSVRRFGTARCRESELLYYTCNNIIGSNKILCFI